MSGSTTNSRPANYNGSPLSIRVFIFRQVSVEIRGQKAWRTCVLGEGKLAPTSPTGPPPSFQTLDQRPNISSSSSCSRAQFSHDLPAPRYCTGCDGTALESLDWDGMVKVQSDTMGSDVGGFTAGRLAVKVRDFLFFLPFCPHLFDSSLHPPLFPPLLLQFSFIMKHSTSAQSFDMLVRVHARARVVIGS